MPKTRTSFKPGNNANPKGRPPKGYSITEMMKEMLSSDPKVKEKLGKVIIAKALEGDTTAIKTVWQYMDGMPKQSMDVTSAGKPLPILGGVSVSSDNSNSQDSQTNQEN